MTLQEQLDQLDPAKCLAISALIAVIYYFFFFDNGQNLKSQAQKNRDELIKKQQELNKIKTSLENKETFEQENKKLFQNMKDFERYFTPNVNNSVLMSMVSKSAEESNITINSLKPNQPHEEFPEYPEKVISMDVHGYFHNLMEFISRLTQLQRVVNFTDMKLKVVGEQDSPIVNLKMNLVVYNAKSTGEDKTQ